MAAPELHIDPDVAATSSAYGDDLDTLALLRSSGHPPRAGAVATRLERTLSSALHNKPKKPD